VNPWKPKTGGGPRSDSGIKTTVIHITRLPHNVEPKYVRTLFASEDNLEIQDVFTPKPNGRGEAWVQFKNQADATFAAENYDSKHFGTNNQKINIEKVAKVTLESIKKDPGVSYLRYSDTLREEDPTLTTKTVFITGLPPSGPLANISGMIMTLCYDEDDDDEDYEPHGRKEKRVIQGNSPRHDVLLQFYSVEDAVCFREEFNDTYW
jgi:hypothetical protein